MRRLVIVIGVAALYVSITDAAVQRNSGASVAQQVNDISLGDIQNNALLPQVVNVPIDEQYQLEKAVTGEIRYNELEDLLQTRENQEIESVEELRRLGFPTEIPVSAAQRLIENRLGSVSVSVNQAVHPYLAYQEPLNQDELENCPRTQNYQCRSVYRNMPCFYYTPPFGSREVCCPIGAPTQVGNCNCQKCAVMEPTSISLGKCLRRWRTRQVDSFCYNFNSGSVAFREISRSVPSSCYCSKTSCNTSGSIYDWDFQLRPENRNR